jgi:hypothetical protein
MKLEKHLSNMNISGKPDKSWGPGILKIYLVYLFIYDIEKNLGIGLTWVIIIF